jgi:cytochrome c peroxidase
MTSRRNLAVLVLGVGLVSTIGIMAQENHGLSLKDIPIGEPTAAVVDGGTPLNQNHGDPKKIPGPDQDLPFQDLVAAGIVKDKDKLIQLGKAFFWDMQVGSDGVQACATCHFSAGADSRSKNQISPGLQDNNFHGLFISGDNTFGNSTVPYTGNDPHTPNPPGPCEPPPTSLNVPGFPQFKPNYQLRAQDFPLNGWLRPTERTPRGSDTSFLDEFANVSRDTNDGISSQGVRHSIFKAVTPGVAVEQSDPEKDIFNLASPGQVSKDSLVRRVPPRNAPTVINAVFNFDNFWDGRASFIFNGVNPFGFRDRLSTLKQLDNNGALRNVYVRITNSSLASQATGPTPSNFEMSSEHRSFPDVGKKMVSMRPLAKQLVHPEDSVLGSLSRAHLGGGGKVEGDAGLNATYEKMIQDAFKEAWWSSPEPITRQASSVGIQAASTNNPRTMARGLGSEPVKGGKGETEKFTQMQWNFSLFWALAIQAYEATLIADETPFDRFEGASSKDIKADPTALNASELNGLTIFTDADPNLGGRCNNCHSLPVSSNHSAVDIVQKDFNKPGFQGRPIDIIEFMAMGDGGSANYDKGFYNIGVRRSSEDVGRAGTAPASTLENRQQEFENDLDDVDPKTTFHKPFPLSYVALGHLAAQNKLPDDVLRFIQLDPVTHKPVPVLDRQGINGNFKAPNLRNVQLTGPYFHNGDSATLRQVVEFYTRGGNFPNTNFRDLDPDIEGIPSLRFPEFLPSARKNVQDLVNFVSHGLLDERVALEKAPFDHPQLIVPNGVNESMPGQDSTLDVPAIGRNGRTKPISTFLDLDPQDPIVAASGVGAAPANTACVFHPATLVAGQVSISGIESDPTQPVQLSWHTNGTPAVDDPDWVKAAVDAKTGRFSATVNIDHPGSQSAMFYRAGSGPVTFSWSDTPSAGATTKP